jgi:hypothetical protein
MPYFLVFRRYAPFTTFGFGFEGDRRTNASTSLSDTARTTGTVMFDRTHIGTLTGISSGTTYQGFGERVAAFMGKHYSNVKTSLSKQHTFANQVSFTAGTEGANPMTPGAPDIDTYLDFSARWLGAAVIFEGTVRGDSFPNAEVFVLDGFGKAALLFNGQTTGSRQTGPLTGLPGSGVNKRVGSFSKSVPIGQSDGFLASSLACPVTRMA